MKLKKCVDVIEFIQLVDKINRAPSSYWRKESAKRSFIGPRDLLVFFNQNSRIMNHYRHHAALENSLRALNRKIQRELDEEYAQIIHSRFLHQIEENKGRGSVHVIFLEYKS